MLPGTYFYHEKNRGGGLCRMHTVNNALGEKYFVPESWGKTMRELGAKAGYEDVWVTDDPMLDGWAMPIGLALEYAQPEWLTLAVSGPALHRILKNATIREIMDTSLRRIIVYHHSHTWACRGDVDGRWFNLDSDQANTTLMATDDRNLFESSAFSNGVRSLHGGSGIIFVATIRFAIQQWIPMASVVGLPGLDKRIRNTIVAIATIKRPTPSTREHDTEYHQHHLRAQHPNAQPYQTHPPAQHTYPYPYEHQYPAYMAPQPYMAPPQQPYMAPHQQPYMAPHQPPYMAEAASASSYAEHPEPKPMRPRTIRLGTKPPDLFGIAQDVRAAERRRLEQVNNEEANRKITDRKEMAETVLAAIGKVLTDDGKKELVSVAGEEGSGGVLAAPEELQPPQPGEHRLESGGNIAPPTPWALRHKVRWQQRQYKERNAQLFQETQRLIDESQPQPVLAAPSPAPAALATPTAPTASTGLASLAQHPGRMSVKDLFSYARKMRETTTNPPHGATPSPAQPAPTTTTTAPTSFGPFSSAPMTTTRTPLEPSIPAISMSPSGLPKVDHNPLKDVVIVQRGKDGKMLEVGNLVIGSKERQGTECSILPGGAGIAVVSGGGGGSGFMSSTLPRGAIPAPSFPKPTQPTSSRTTPSTALVHTPNSLKFKNHVGQSPLVCAPSTASLLERSRQILAAKGIPPPEDPIEKIKQIQKEFQDAVIQAAPNQRPSRSEWRPKTKRRSAYGNR
jgi:hypothetical protein